MIRFEGVHKSFGAHEVLKGIDARIGKGEVVCLMRRPARASPRCCAA